MAWKIQWKTSCNSFLQYIMFMRNNKAYWLIVAQPDFIYVFTHLCDDKPLQTIISVITSSYRLLVISDKTDVFWAVSFPTDPRHPVSHESALIFGWAVTNSTFTHFIVLSFNTEPRVKNNNQSRLTPLFIFEQRVSHSPLGSTVHRFIKLLNIMLFKVL